MFSRPLFWGVSVAGLCFMLLLIYRSRPEEGVRQIQTAARQEIAPLFSSQASLRLLRLGPETGTYVTGSGPSTKGYFEFDGIYANQPCRVFVIWHGADTNALIDQVEIGSTSKELKTIWSRK